jgi:hypothetical protein
MEHTIEFHGRLCRADGRPANPGTYDLAFRLHENSETPAAVWQEEVKDVPVAAGGFYHVILGRSAALRPQMFVDAPTFLSVSVIRSGRAAEEIGDRVPLLGSTLRLSASVEEMEARLAVLETRRDDDAPGAPDPELKKRVLRLRRRLKRLERGGGALAAVLSRLSALEQRLQRLDGDEGRIARIEDELEDIVGPDGDIVDLTERLDAVEGLPRRSGVLSPEVRLEQLERRVAAVEAARAETPSDLRPPPRARPKA